MLWVFTPIAAVHAQTPASETAPDAAAAADSPEYRIAIDEAVEEFKNGVWTQARGAFARAHELQPSARTFRGLGLSSFYLLDYVAARVAFEQALADQRRPLTDAQREELIGLLRRTVQETGRYQLQLSPTDARFAVDDVVRKDTVLVLARGKHKLWARSEGYQLYESTLEVNGGEDSTLEIVLSKDQGASIAPAQATPPADSAPNLSAVHTDVAPEEAAPNRTAMWVALAAAPVFAGVATAIWFVGKGKLSEIEKECNEKCTTEEGEQRKRDAHLGTYETLATVGWVAAGASLLTAGVLFVLQDGDSTSSSTQLSISATPTSAGALFSTRL